MDVDFGRTSEDYGRYRAGFPTALFERLAARGIGLPGQRVLDLATGTGTMARHLALRRCQVTALDVAEAQLEQARQLDRAAGVRVTYLVAPAEETGLPAAGFDVVTAGQSWHWFDRPRAAREVRRLLVAGGRLVIAYLDWLPLAGSVVQATEALILRYHPAWPYANDTGLHPEWSPGLARAGFSNIETFSFDLDIPYSHEAWRGRIRASAPIGASLPPEEVAAFDDELKSLLAGRFPQDPLAIPHRVFAITCTSS